MKTLTERGVIGLARREALRRQEARQARRELLRAFFNVGARPVERVGAGLIAAVAGLLTGIGIFGVVLQYLTR